MKSQIKVFLHINKKNLLNGEVYEINPKITIRIDYIGSLLISYTIL